MQQITRGYQIFGQSDSDWSHTWTKSSAVVLAVLFHCPWMGNRANPVESPHGTWIPSDKILLVYPTVWWSSSKLYHPINSLINSFRSHRLGGYGRWWILWNISSAKGSASRKNGRVCGRIGRIGRKGRMRRSVAKRQKKKLHLKLQLFGNTEAHCNVHWLQPGIRSFRRGRWLEDTPRSSSATPQVLRFRCPQPPTKVWIRVELQQNVSAVCTSRDPTGQPESYPNWI